VVARRGAPGEKSASYDGARGGSSKSESGRREGASGVAEAETGRTTGFRRRPVPWGADESAGGVSAKMSACSTVFLTSPPSCSEVDITLRRREAGLAFLVATVGVEEPVRTGRGLRPLAEELPEDGPVALGIADGGY